MNPQGVNNIIHIVAPSLQQNTKPTRQEKDQLKNSYIECLKLAKKNNHRTIALPGIGTGVYNWSATDSLTLLKEALSDPEFTDSFDQVLIIDDLTRNQSIPNAFDKVFTEDTKPPELTFTPRTELRGEVLNSATGFTNYGVNKIDPITTNRASYERITFDSAELASDFSRMLLAGGIGRKRGAMFTGKIQIQPRTGSPANELLVTKQEFSEISEFLKTRTTKNLLRIGLRDIASKNPEDRPPGDKQTTMMNQCVDILMSKPHNEALTEKEVNELQTLFKNLLLDFNTDFSPTDGLNTMEKFTGYVEDLRSVFQTTPKKASDSKDGPLNFKTQLRSFKDKSFDMSKLRTNTVLDQLNIKSPMYSIVGNQVTITLDNGSKNDVSNLYNLLQLEKGVVKEDEKNPLVFHSSVEKTDTGVTMDLDTFNSLFDLDV